MGPIATFFLIAIVATEVITFIYRRRAPDAAVMAFVTANVWIINRCMHEMIGPAFRYIYPINDAIGAAICLGLIVNEVRVRGQASPWQSIWKLGVLLLLVAQIGVMAFYPFQAPLAVRSPYLAAMNVLTGLQLLVLVLAALLAPAMPRTPRKFDYAQS